MTAVFTVAFFRNAIPLVMLLLRSEFDISQFMNLIIRLISMISITQKITIDKLWEPSNKADYEIQEIKKEIGSVMPETKDAVVARLFADFGICVEESNKKEDRIKSHPVI